MLKLRSFFFALSVDPPHLLSTRGSARKFHQTMIVGFVEACKGIRELFDPARAPAQSMSPKGSAAATAGSAPTEDEAEAAAVDEVGQACLYSAVLTRRL